MKKLICRLAGVLALVCASATAQAQATSLPLVPLKDGTSSWAVGAVPVDSTGAEKGTSANPLVVSTTTPGAATSTPLTGTVNDTSAHTFGPFTPQLARAIWATLVGTGASGTAQLLRSTDGGTTKAGLTAGGTSWASWSFTTTTGAIVNEQVSTETDSAATYYLAVTLTAGSLTYRIAQ